MKPTETLKKVREILRAKGLAKNWAQRGPSDAHPHSVEQWSGPISGGPIKDRKFVSAMVQFWDDGGTTVYTDIGTGDTFEELEKFLTP